MNAGFSLLYFSNFDGYGGSHNIVGLLVDFIAILIKDGS